LSGHYISSILLLFAGILLRYQDRSISISDDNVRYEVFLDIILEFLPFFCGIKENVKSVKEKISI